MTKEELLQYRAKCKELRQIEERIQDVRANARSAKAVRYDSVPSKGNGEPVAAVQSYIEQLEILSALYENEKADLTRDVIAIELAITSLPSELRTLMRYRYIDGLKWETINDLLYLSAPTSKRMHRRALAVLQK